MLFSIITNLIVWLVLNYNIESSVWQSPGPIIFLKPQAEILKLTSPRAAVFSVSDQLFLLTKKADEIQPIASITKLMTALVFLDNNPGWDNIYEIGAADKVSGGRLNLFPGDRVKLRDLFYTSLVASDNGATLALVHASGLSEKEFVLRMNIKARELNLEKTQFSDPVGLSDDNISNAREVALLAKVALAREEIRLATSKRDYLFNTLGGKEKEIESTDDLLFAGNSGTLQVLGGKTGYTEKAGYCFVGLLKNSAGREFISVILNSNSRAGRFAESQKLVDWIINNYEWQKD